MNIEHVKEIASRISELQGISMADALIIATNAMKQASEVKADTDTIITKSEFVKMLERGTVEFSYRNRKGVIHTTKGTLNPSLITSRKKVLGSKIAKDEHSVAFYDRNHGVYCTVKMRDLIKIF